MFFLQICLLLSFGWLTANLTIFIKTNTCEKLWIEWLQNFEIKYCRSARTDSERKQYYNSLPEKNLNWIDICINNLLYLSTRAFSKNMTVFRIWSWIRLKIETLMIVVNRNRWLNFSNHQVLYSQYTQNINTMKDCFFFWSWSTLNVDALKIVFTNNI